MRRAIALSIIVLSSFGVSTGAAVALPPYIEIQYIKPFTSMESCETHRAQFGPTDYPYNYSGYCEGYNGSDSGLYRYPILTQSPFDRR